MLISAAILDETLAPVFEYHTEINPQRIFMLAEDRETEAHQRGVEWSINRINLAGKHLVDTVAASSADATVLQNEIENIVVALWVYQSLFMNVNAKSFTKANLELKISSDGTVQSTSHPNNFD